jgi:transposase
MAQALSVDLRRRVVDAVASGMSRRQAALRFGVSASSAIRWTAQAESSGDVTPKKQGGDRKSQRIEAHAAFLLAAIAHTPDLTLAELQARLAAEHGARFGIGTLWRFFDRRRITFKKRRRTPPSRSGTT